LDCVPGQRSAHYSAVMNGDGSLCAGIADMEIFDSFDPSIHTAITDKLVVMCANLSEKTIRKIALGSKVPVWLDCVSVAKADRIVHSLPYLSLVKANLDELATLAAVTPIDDPSDSQALLTWVSATVRVCVDQYAANAFLVTCGKYGVFFVSPQKANVGESPHKSSFKLADGSSLDVDHNVPSQVPQLGITRYSSAPIEAVVDCTGAGDCLFGATAWAHAIVGLPIEKAIVVGIAAARLTLMSPLSVATEISEASMASLVHALQGGRTARL
jgi:sugar/nucleoside kinase (ribokinase family)